MKSLVGLLSIFLFSSLCYASEITTVVDTGNVARYYDKENKEVIDKSEIDKYKTKYSEQKPQFAEVDKEYEARKQADEKEDERIKEERAFELKRARASRPSSVSTIAGPISVRVMP